MADAPARKKKKKAKPEAAAAAPPPPPAPKAGAALPPARRYGPWSLWRLSAAGGRFEKWDEFDSEREAEAALVERVARVRAFEKLAGRGADAAADERWFVLHRADRLWIGMRQRADLTLDTAAPIVEEPREVALDEPAARRWMRAAELGLLPAEDEATGDEPPSPSPVGGCELARGGASARLTWSTFAAARPEEPPTEEDHARPPKKRRRPAAPQRYAYYVRPALATELRLADGAHLLGQTKPAELRYLLTRGPGGPSPGDAEYEALVLREARNARLPPKPQA